MVSSDILQAFILRLLCRVKNDSNIHHDIDEQALRRHERSQVAPFGIEAKCESLTGIDHDPIFRFVAGQVVPNLPGGEKKKPEIMHRTIRLSMFDESTVPFGLFFPPIIVSSPVKYPKQSAQKTFTPVRPRFGFMMPFALFCE